MKKNGGSIHTVDVLFPLLFILLFCFCALLVVLQGARIYEKTAAGLEENYTVRTVVSYLQEKVRECGDASLISVQEMEGQQVLVIDSVHGEEMYSSYIYLEDGSLKELFVKKADFAGLEGGQRRTYTEDGLFFCGVIHVFSGSGTGRGAGRSAHLL